MIRTVGGALSLDALIAEWGIIADEPKAEILRRLCHFGQSGLVFDRRVFRRHGGDYVRVEQVAFIASRLVSTDSIAQADAMKALSELEVITAAVRAFCAVTGTRLPDLALKLESRGAWLQYKYHAPTFRDPAAHEINAANFICKMEGIEQWDQIKYNTLTIKHMPRGARLIGAHELGRAGGRIPPPVTSRSRSDRGATTVDRNMAAVGDYVASRLVSPLLPPDEVMTISEASLFVAEQFKSDPWQERVWVLSQTDDGKLEMHYAPPITDWQEKPLPLDPCYGSMPHQPKPHAKHWRVLRSQLLEAIRGRVAQWAEYRIDITNRSGMVAQPLTGEPQKALTNGAKPEQKPMSEQALEAWYREFARTWPLVRQPNDKEEQEALKADHPDKSVTRKRMRKARADFGPAHWYTRGRRPAAGNSADNSAAN